MLVWEVMFVQEISEQDYHNALSKVKEYEKQQSLNKLNERLKTVLRNNFRNYVFKEDCHREIIIFTGVTLPPSGDLRLSKAVCGARDEYEPIIGKLVCVYKALGRNVEMQMSNIDVKNAKMSNYKKPMTIERMPFF